MLHKIPTVVGFLYILSIVTSAYIRNRSTKNSIYVIRILTRVR